MKFAAIILLFLSYSVFASENINLVSTNKSEKYCLDKLIEACQTKKKDTQTFYKCAKEKTEVGCKHTLTRMILNLQAAEKKRNEASEEMKSCNNILHEKCSQVGKESAVEKAKCFKEKFQELSINCKTIIKDHFNKTSNEKQVQ